MPGADTTCDRALGFLGLCRRAGRLICGVPLLCEAMHKKGRVALVVCAVDASAATRRKLESQCAYYHVPLYTLPVGTEQLAHALGKTGALAAAAVTDPAMARALVARLPAGTKEAVCDPHTECDRKGTP